MATQANTPGRPTSSAWVNTLIEGGKWTDAGGVVTITYSFMDGASGSPFSGSGATWDAASKAATVAAFECWSNVCNIDFVEAGSSASADFWYWLGSDYQLGDDGTLGWHEMPAGGQSGPLNAAFSYEGSGWDADGLEQGGYGFVTLIHEIGHGIGLAHPHADYRGEEAFPGVSKPFNDFGDYNLNQGIFTTMSYNDGWQGQRSNSDNYGYQATAMALDIAAAQQIYGANTTYDPTDQYDLPVSNVAGTFWSCIWDTGGTDEISAAGTNLAAVINLNDAELVGAYAGGYISQVAGIMGGFTIAANAVIENAVGGNGNDRISGNEIANVLTGGAGNDLIIGGSGNDTLDGGTGQDDMRGGFGADVFSVDSVRDLVFEAAGQGSDTVETTLTVYRLSKNVENLVMLSNAGVSAFGSKTSNEITGGNGNDHLNGGRGADTLTGGLGADSFDFLTLADSKPSLAICDVITDFDQGSDVIDLSGVISGAFIWNSTTAAHSRSAELWYQTGTDGHGNYTLVNVDKDGDSASEMLIRLTGWLALTADDFVL